MRGSLQVLRGGARRQNRNDDDPWRIADGGTSPARMAQENLARPSDYWRQGVMGSDAPPDRYEPPKGFSVTLGVDKPAEVERIFKAFASHGPLQMPLEKTFFAESFGMVVDQFGTPWIVVCEPAA